MDKAEELLIKAHWMLYTRLRHKGVDHLDSMDTRLLDEIEEFLEEKDACELIETRGKS